jgi:thiamine biosynthesis protein ThiI
MKFISLLSSGIDSPVATYLISEYADEIVIVHGDIRPFTDNREIENFKKIVNYLKTKISCKIKTYVVPHGQVLSDFKEGCKNRFTCIFCKRMLLRYAEEIAKKEEAEAIVMGDSLGQVASQTLQNIRAIDQAVSIPILRPLIGLDKEDIVNISKEIGTYELSIAKSKSCSAVPNKPATKAKSVDILIEEEKINVKEIVKNAVKNAYLFKT